MTELYADRPPSARCKVDKVLKIRNDNLLILVHPPKTVEIETRTVELEEKGVKLRLTVVDTPGFGDGMNSTERLNSLFDYFK
jgi:septin family protein